MSEVVFLSLYKLLAAGWRRRYLIVVPLLLMPIVGLIVGKFTPRQWETHTTVLIQESAKLNPFLEDLSVSTNLEERMAALDTLVHSRHVLLSVARDLNMLGEDATDKERDEVVGQLSRALSVRLVGSDLVKITLKRNTPDELVQILSEVRDRFLDNLLAPELSSLNASESFLREQLDERKVSLRNAEQALAEFKRVHASDLPDLRGANVTRLRELKDDLSERRTSLAGAQASLESIRTRLIQVDPVIGRLEEQIVALTSELALLRARYTDNHSKVQGTLRKLKRIEIERQQQIQGASTLAKTGVERLWSLAEGLTEEQKDTGRGSLLISQLQELQNAETMVKRLAQEVFSIESEFRDLDQRVASFGEIERTMSELERDLEVQRDLYADLLQRFERARVTGALGRYEQPERVKIIDEAYEPSAPSNMPLIFFLVGGVLGGLGIGLGLAMLAELTDTTIRYRDQLSNLVEAPVLCRIPALKTQRNQPKMIGEVS